jgi:hypothetical protein
MHDLDKGKRKTNLKEQHYTDTFVFMEVNVDYEA